MCWNILHHAHSEEDATEAQIGRSLGEKGDKCGARAWNHLLITFVAVFTSLSECLLLSGRRIWPFILDDGGGTGERDTHGMLVHSRLMSSAYTLTVTEIHTRSLSERGDTDCRKAQISTLDLVFDSDQTPKWKFLTIWSAFSGPNASSVMVQRNRNCMMVLWIGHNAWLIKLLVPRMPHLATRSNCHHRFNAAETASAAWRTKWYPQKVFWWF